MDTVVKFITENETVIMSALFIMILLLTAAVFVTDIINQRHIKKNKTLKEEQDTTPEIKYVEEDEELEKTRAQEELKNLKEELIKADKMLDKPKEEPVLINDEEELEVLEEVDKVPTLDELEAEQEKNAIISIDELNKIGDTKYEENEIIKYEDEGNEPISIQELEELYKAASSVDQEENVTVVEEAPITVKEEPIEEKIDIPIDEFKFKNSPIISPVFGTSKEPDTTEVSSLDKLAEEIRKTNEFLNTLRELRKKLE